MDGRGVLVQNNRTNLWNKPVAYDDSYQCLCMLCLCKYT